MRRLPASLAPIVLVLALALPCLAPAQDGDLRAGFRGLAWGSPVSALPGASLLRGGGVMDYYTRDGDDPTFAGVPLYSIRYGFVAGRLGYIGLVYADPTKTKTLADHLTLLYGRPTTAPATGPNAGVMTWEAAPLTIELAFDQAQSLGFVHVFHRPAMDAIGAGLTPEK
jgi:hypothetical protein